MPDRAFQACLAKDKLYEYENRVIFIAHLAKNEPDGYENQRILIARQMKKSELFQAK